MVVVSDRPWILQGLLGYFDYIQGHYSAEATSDPKHGKDNSCQGD